MPTISVFYGIIIYLYFFDNQKHRIPISTPAIRGNKLRFQSLTERC